MLKARDERKGGSNKVRIGGATKNIPGSFSVLLTSCWLKFLPSTPCHHATQNRGNLGLPLTAGRKDARSVKIRKGKDDAMFKVRRSRCLCTLVVTDQEGAEMLTWSLPPGLAEKERK